MNKAQQMLAKAGFPDTAAGKTAFHKQYPTPEAFFQVHGDQYKNGGPIMYGNGTKVYSTFDQNTKQVGNNYASNITDASTNIDPNGNTSQQYTRQTTNPNSTPYMRYFNDNELGSEMHIVGPNSNMFVTPDPMMDNFLKTRTNYMSGAMAGEQMKRNGGMIKYDDRGKLPQGVLRSRLEAHMSPNQAQSYINSYAHGGTVDALQLMGMPTPRMYGGGSGVHPTLTLSTENNLNPSFKPQYSNNPYYNKTYSVNNRNTVAGTLPLINNKLNLTGSYSDANDGTYTGGLELNIGDILSGAGGKGPSRRYDNPDIAHKGNNSFLDTYGHLRAGVTNKGDKVLPYFGGDFTVAHQMGRVKGPNGLRQPKGTAYANAELNQVEDPLNAIYENDNYMRANLGGSYNFGKGLGVYGEAGYDFMRNAPRGEIGLKKTFAQGGHVTDYSPSSNFGHVQSDNTTYRHGYANGGPVGKYDFGSTIKDIGAGAYGALEGVLDTVTMGATDQLTDKGYTALQKAGGSSESEITQQNSIHGYGQAAGAITGAIVNPASLPTAIKEGSQGIGQGISQGSPDSKSAQQWGKGIEMVGGVAGMATGMGAFGAPGGGASGLAKTNSFNASDIGKFSADASKVGQGFNAMNSGNPMQMMSTFGGMGGGSNMGGTGASNFSPDPNKYMNQGINFNATTPSFRAMGGAVNAPNMMQYGHGGRTMLPPNVSTGRAIVNKYDDGGFLNKMGSAGMMGLAPALIAGKMADGGLLGTMIPLAKPFMADGGNTPATEINVERGELLVNKDGKILTEYRGGGMVPHPEDGGMDDRGTVPAKEGDFVITKRLAPNYKAAMTNNDKLYADSMRNNIAFDKQRKDAKQQAEQQSQQEMMQDMMMAKFGGMVGQYGYGGGVKMYGLGGPPEENGTPYAQSNPYTSLQTNPYAEVSSEPQYNKGNYLNSMLTPLYHNTTFGGPPPIETDMGGSDSYQYENPTYNPTWTNRGGSPPSIEMDMQGSPSYQYGDNPGIQTILADQDRKRDMMDNTWQPGSKYGSDGRGTDVSGYTSTAGSEQSGFNPNMLDMLPFAATAGLGLEALLQKPFQMNAADYQIKTKVDPYEEQYRPDYRPYNAAMYAMRKAPGSGSLAGITNLYNARQKNFADEKYKVNQGNLGRKMTAQQTELGIEGQNLSTAMNIAQFNEQNKAGRRNAIREQFGKNLPADVYNYQTNQIGKEALSARYPDHEFSWERSNRRNGRSV